MMNKSDAINLIFTDSLQNKLVKCLLSYEEKDRADAIIIFTGYGTKIVEEVSRIWRGEKIFIVGPDSLEWRKNKDADAEFYQRFIMQKYLEIPTDKIKANRSQETKHANGQSIIAAKEIKEREWKNVILVTAAYHLPRAYMTLLKALKGNRLEKEVKIIPKFCDMEDWEVHDYELKDNFSWVSKLMNEKNKIAEYQNNGDVAEWSELEEYLVHHKMLTK